MSPLFAVTPVSVDWNAVGSIAWTVLTVLWHVVLVVGVLLAVVFGFVALIRTAKGKGIVQAVEDDVKAVAPTAEEIALAVFNKMQGGPAAPVEVPNHPAVTAVIDMVQEAKAVKDALAKVATLSTQVTAAATTPAAPK